MEHDPERQRIAGVQDHRTYSELQMVFGEDGARDRLLSFRHELLTYLDLTGKLASDLAELRNMAHRISGRAGFLGFPGLADASSKLDESSRLNKNVAEALDQWIEQVRMTVEYLPNEKAGSALDAKDIPPHR